MKLLYYIYSRTLSDIQCYTGTRIEYFAPIDGNKVIVCKDYIGIIDLWFPSERNLFDLTSPILSGWLISETRLVGKCRKSLFDYLIDDIAVGTKFRVGEVEYVSYETGELKKVQTYCIDWEWMRRELKNLGLL